MPYIPRGNYVSDPSRIEELILRGGEINAERQRRSGEIWGTTLANLGQVIGQGVSQVMETRKLAKQDAALVDLLKKNPNASFAEIQQRVGPQKAKIVYEGLEAQKRLEIATSQQQRMDTDAARDDFSKVALGFAGAIGPGAQAHAWPGVRSLAIRAGFYRPEDLPEEFSPEVAAGVAEFGKSMTKKPEEPFTLGEGQVRFGADGKRIAEGPPKAAPTVNLQHVETAEGIRPFNPVTGELGPVIAKGKPSASSQNADEEPLTPEAKSMAARLFLQTGQLPSMGYGKQAAANRREIMNEAARQDPNANLAATKAAYGADTGALKKLQAQTDAVAAFESTASKNAAMLDKLMEKTPDVGAKFLNRPLRALKGTLGDEDLAAFEAARQSVQNEYARIISNPNLSGTMSDSARKEGEAIMSPDATVGQIRRALKVLAQEAKNRHDSYQGQLDQIKGRMSGGKPKADPLGLFEK